MIARLFGAIHFLSGVGVSACPPGRSAVFFPLLGAALGWLGAQWFGLLDPLFGTSISALCVLAFWSLVTGAKQETGTIQSMGGIGIVSVIVITVLRWQSLVRLPSAPVLEMTAALAASRASLVALAFLSRPIGDEPRLATALSTPAAVLTALQGVIIAFLPGLRAGMLTLCASILSVWLLYRWFDHKLGGVSSQALHATSLLCETLSLVLVSCRNCI